MDTIHLLVKHLAACKQRTIMATIVDVEGSAYRKEGTSILIQEDGFEVGVLSAGCLETDISARFNDVWENGARMNEYDMREADAFTWGINNSGCNGILTVLVEPVTEQLYNDLMKVKQCLALGQEVWITKKIHENRVLASYQPEDGDSFGNWNMDLPERISSKSQMVQSVFFHRYVPRQHLYVFGANVDARPLVQFALNVGFQVTVCDWRPQLCTNEHFPEGTKFVTGFPSEILPTLTFNKTDFVILMTHHFQYDQEILSSLLDIELRYIGVLGSQKRTKRLLGTDVVPTTITSPIGLAIQAESPEEIAISVVSELIAVSKKVEKEKYDSSILL